MAQKQHKKFQFWIPLIAVLMCLSLACAQINSLVDFLSGGVEDLNESLEYPEAEFLFEVIPFGYIQEGNYRHAIRWRIFTTDAQIEPVNEFYQSAVPGWQLQQDEIINGHRYIVLSGNHPLSSVFDKTTFERVLKQGGTLAPGVLDIEVLNSTGHAGLGRLNLIFEQNMPPTSLNDGDRLSIPGDTTLILIADYVKQDINATETPKPEEPEPQESDYSEACRQAVESGFCTNPYFPPIEGMTLVYLVDGHKRQTRQFGPVQPDVQAPGDSRMDSFTVLFTDDDFTGEIEFFCTEEGLMGGDSGSILASVLETQDVEGGQIKLESTTFEGVVLPSQLSPGDTWESMVEVVFSAPEGVMLRSIGNARYVFEGYETITVPAGTFQAQKIIIDMDVEVIADLPDGTSFPVAAVNIVSVSFYVECVGIVMSEGGYNLELVEIILP